MPYTEYEDGATESEPATTSTDSDIPDSTDDTVANDIAQHAQDIATAVSDPAALARLLADYVRTHYGTRVQTAYWITVNKARDSDQGITLVVRKLPFSTTLRLMLGGHTAGFGVYSRPFAITDHDHALSISVGVGFVGDFHFDKLSPVLSVAVKF